MDCPVTHQANSKYSMGGERYGRAPGSSGGE